MADYEVSSAVDTFMQSTDQAGMRTNLALGNAATKSTGTTAGTVAEGDDSRFTNSRTPTGSAGGDLSGTYPNPTVSKLQGRTVSSTAPTSGQVLGWNGTQWVPVAASGSSEEYPLLVVVFSGPAIGTYTIPSNYKWCDLILASGGEGGDGGNIRSSSDGESSYGAIGGKGGSCGTVIERRRLWVYGGTIGYDLGAGGAGGAGGVLQSGATYAVGNTGGTGGTSRLWWANAPLNFPNTRIGIVNYADDRSRQPSFSIGSAGGYLTQGTTPQITSWNSQPLAIVQPGAGGSGAASDTTNDSVINGGVACDANGMLVDQNGDRTSFVYEGRVGFPDADPIPPSNNVVGFSVGFFGGAGGAGVFADAPVGAYSRGGDGGDAQPGGGGGGGGGCFCGTNAVSNGTDGMRAGNGGDGGGGFFVLFLSK
jgi:hypothetical protein